MRKYIFTILVLFIWSALLNAGVIRKSTSEVSFVGTGKFLVQTTIKIEGNKRLEDSKKKFKGAGLMGGLMAKTVLRPGHTAKVVSLDDQTVMDVNHKKQTFRIFPLEQIDWEEDNNEGVTEENSTSDESEEQEESNIRITKNEFKVTATGKNKTINKFPCSQYEISWLVEWEDTETGETGMDKLLSQVWTTEPTAEMLAAEKEAMAFNVKYAKKIGFDMDDQRSEILGTRWLSMFQAMNPGSGRQAKADDAQWASELKKIKGSPVVTSGKYYFTRKKPAGEEEEEKVEEEKPDFSNPRGAFGSIMKNAFGKKRNSSKKKGGKLKPAFSYRTELKKLEQTSIDPGAFAPPAGYKDNSQR